MFTKLSEANLERSEWRLGESVEKPNFQTFGTMINDGSKHLSPL